MRPANLKEEVQRLQRHKSAGTGSAVPLGEELIDFYKRSVIKRQGKLAKLAEKWGELVPENLCDHCALESFSRGTLVVLVDSASHLYEIKQLLLAGLQDQLLIACKSAALRKINLKAGRWYEANDGGEDKRVRFK